MSKVAVVILNFNGRKFLEQFLPSVIKNSDVHEIIVADNDSTDDSVVFLRNNFPNINVIQNAHNQGFAGGYNEALKHVTAEYYVLLNSDVEVTPNWIQPIINLMATDKLIASCQPKIRSFHQKTHFEYAGAAGGYIDWLGYPFCRGRVFDSYEEDLGQYDDSKEIFWATGACMFVRAEVFHEMGGFDANFFAHMEEIDLCWRMKNAGYKIFYCSDSVVFHVGGGTLHKSNPRKTFLNYRNGLAMLYKNLPTTKLIYTIFLRLILDGISGIKLLLGGSIADVWAIIKAHFAFYAMIPKLERKSPKEVSQIYQKSIVWEYFFKKKKPQI
jgi:GT2 family glycosyltransferase